MTFQIGSLAQVYIASGPITLSSFIGNIAKWLKEGHVWRQDNY